MEAAKAAPTKRNMPAAPGCNKSARRGKNPLTPRGDADSLPAMKNVLSLLVAFVFVQTQCWALSGGPVYTGTQGSVQGTYAGVLIPTGIGSNALGLFTLGVPQTGLASGSFAMFAGGGTFFGTMLGIMDPDTLTLSAVAEGQESVRRSFTDTLGVTGVSSQVVATGSGAIKATLVKANANKSLTQGTGAQRLVGSGALATKSLANTLDPFFFFDFGSTFVPGDTVSFTVDGFKQSGTATGTLNVNSLTGGIAAPVTPTAAP